MENSTQPTYFLMETYQAESVIFFYKCTEKNMELVASEGIFLFFSLCIYVQCMKSKSSEIIPFILDSTALIYLREIFYKNN